MKTYIQPNTTAIQLSAKDRLCQEVIVSVGGNGGFTVGGPASGSDYKPM